MMRLFMYGPESETISLEALHVYRSRGFHEEVACWAPWLRSIQDRQPWVLWVDDQHGVAQWEMSELEDALSAFGLTPAGIYSEAAFVPVALSLVERFEGEGDVPGLVKDGVPTCTALAASWTLARLGLVEVDSRVCLRNQPLKACGAAYTVLRGHDVAAEKKVAQCLGRWFPSLEIAQRRIKDDRLADLV